MKKRVMIYSSAVFMMLAQSTASHSLTDSVKSLTSYAKQGKFFSTPDIKALIKWADNDGLYARCEVQDISKLSETKHCKPGASEEFLL